MSKAIALLTKCKLINEGCQILLRNFNLRDVYYLVKFLNNKNVTQYMTSRIAEPYTVQDAEWWVNSGSQNGIAQAIEVNDRFAGVIREMEKNNHPILLVFLSVFCVVVTVT